MSTALPKMLTTKDIAAYFSVKERAARELMKRIGCIEEVGKLYVLQDDLLAYLAGKPRTPIRKPEPAPESKRRPARRWQYTSSNQDCKIARRKPNGA